MNHNTFAKQFDFLLSPVPEENELKPVSPQNTQTSHSNLKPQEVTKSKDFGKSKHGMGNLSVYQCKYSLTSAKRKPVPVCVHSHPSAEAVLRERKVEIKDLESQVVYLQNQIKELKVENKTLLDIQSRQEKELRKFKGGVSDIPALLRSHKDEIKASEKTALSLRRELWECQKDLKTKSDIVLRKDQHVDKLNLIIKRIEKRLQEISLENKKLKVDKKKLEEANKKLMGGNEELKSETDLFKKKIQEMTTELLNAEEKLGTATYFKSMLENDVCKLQKKYEESLQNEVKLRKLLQTATETVHSQTDSKGTIPKENDISSNTDIHCIAESNIWNQNDAAISDLKSSKCLEPSTPFPSVSTEKVQEPNCGDDLSIAGNSSLKTIHCKNKLYPNADEGDVYVENRMNKSVVPQEELELKFSFSSKNAHSLTSKRLFSNFTLK